MVLLLASALAAPALAVPTAVARVSDDQSNWGKSVTVRQGETVYLDHRLSDIGDDQSINNTDEFAWTANPSTGITITEEATESRFTAPNTSTNLEITLTLTVTNTDDNTTATDTVTVTVRPPNSPPVAVATVDPAQVLPLHRVVLDGSGSTDPDPGDTLSYSWKEVDSSGADVTHALTFVPKVDPENRAKAFVSPTSFAGGVSRPLPAGTTLYFQLTVTDQSGATDTATVSVEILNLRPSGNAGSTQNVQGGTEVTLKAKYVLDPNGDSLTYLWRQVDDKDKPVEPPTVTLATPTQLQTTFIAPDQSVTLRFQLLMTETGTNPPLVGSDSVDVVVHGAVPREVILYGGSYREVEPNTPVVLDSGVSDSRNPFLDTLIYTWQQVDANRELVTDGVEITQLPNYHGRATFIAPNEDVELYFRLQIIFPGRPPPPEDHVPIVTIRVRVPVEEPVIESVGGKQGLALAGNINNALSDRVQDIDVGGGASFRPDNGFALPLSGVPGSPGAVGFWAQVNNSTPSDATESLTWDGENNTTIFGLDWQSSEEGVVGIMFATLEGSFDYTDSVLGVGTLESELTTQTPYMAMIQNSGLRVWGAIGTGTGDMTVTFDGISSDASVDVRNALVGVGQTIKTGSGIEVDVKGEFSTAILDVEETSDSRLAAMSISANQFRLTGVGSMPLDLASGAEFVPALELAVRTDDGDSESGTGVEIGLKLKYVSGKGRFSMAGNFRSMVSTLNDYEESGSQFLIRFEAGSDGRGWAFALEPSYGQTESGADRLWSEDLTDLASGQAAKQAHLGAEMSYGVELPSRHGVLLSPYSRMRQDEAGQNQLRYGMRLSFGESFRLAMSSLNRYGIDGNRDRQTHLTGELRF